MVISDGSGNLSNFAGFAYVASGLMALTNPTYSTNGLQFGVDPSDGSAKFDMRDNYAINFYTFGGYRGNGKIQYHRSVDFKLVERSLLVRVSGKRWSHIVGNLFWSSVLSSIWRYFPNRRTGAGIYSGNATYSLGITKAGNNSSFYNIVTGGSKSPEGDLALTIIRGTVGSGATVVYGEGWSVTTPTAGQYNVTYSQAFGSQPVVIATALNAGYTVYVNDASTTGNQFNISTGAAASFSFIAIGPRGD